MYNDKSRLIVQSILSQIPADCEDACEGFCLQNAFALKVPENYNHATQLDSFRKKYSIHSVNFNFGDDRVCFNDFSDEITDEHFAQVTHKLMPGKTYLGKIFMFHFFKKPDQTTSDNDCLPFLKSQNAILCGAQGLSLAWQYAKEEFPPGNLFSLDEEKALWHGEDDAMIPVIRQFPENHWTFDVMLYGGGKKLRDIRLLCICEMP